MTDQKRDYWSERISQAADDCGLVLTDEQLEVLASAAESGHESWYKRKIKELEEQVRDAHNRGELCAKRLLGLWPDDQLTIDAHGNIERPMR